MSADPQSCSSSNYPSTPPQPKVGCQASPERHAVAPLEVTVFTKDGPLTKRISLNEDSSIKSDGSACLMWHGHAGRAQLDSMQAFADLVGSLGPNQAIALGTLVPNLNDQVAVVTKRDLKGTTAPSVIARTAEHVQYRAGEPALALIDIDLKGIPEGVSAKAKWHGGYRDALSAVLPGLAGAAGVLRASTSSGLRRTDTGEEIEGSGGLHWFVLVKDGADIERFLRALHDRCWLAGLGWMLVGKAGRLLERSLVDRMVYGPERLVFEGRPIVDPPLEQDQEMRRPIVVPGEMVDTRAICPDLTWGERDKLKELQEAEKKRLGKQSRKARGRFIEERAGTIAERHGISHAEAKAIVGQWCDGVLLPKVELQFDDPGLAGCTVGDVLADPERFVGTTLADPLEGVEYGRGKAVVMQRRDGSLCIHSFAHGRTVYRLVEHSQAVATKGYAAREDGGPDADDLWRDELIRGKSGRPLSNFANCLIALRGAHQLRDLFAFDEMELTAVVTRPSLLGDRGVFPQPVTDDTVAGVWDWLQRNGLPSATIDAVHRAVDKVCMDRPFHPVREYLSHLVWDGVSRIDDWLGTYMGAESTPYTRVVGPKWLISGTARVMQPGCKADHVLIFEGEQGLGKSTAAKVLAGGDPWFSDDLPPIGSKDCQEHLPGKWIIELSELSAVSKAETEAVKSFISRTHGQVPRVVWPQAELRAASMRLHRFDQ